MNKASDEALPELASFLEPFVSLIRNRQSRQSLERYLTGLLTDLPRKNCDTVAAALANTTTERLQHLLTDATWNPLEMDEARVRFMSQHSPSGGVLVLDDTGLPKRGKASVGVAHQYSGTLGKQGDCQVVVTAEYVAADASTSLPLHWPVQARLYLPRVWAEDPLRRRRTHIPESVTFAPKTDLALALLDQARGWQVPFSAVVADAGYGDASSFLHHLEDRQVAYVCAVARSFGVRLPHEIAEAAESPTTPLPR
nr:IS701 family transposase [Anaerolineae bacterium]